MEPWNWNASELADALVLLVGVLGLVAIGSWIWQLWLWSFALTEERNTDRRQAAASQAAVGRPRADVTFRGVN